MLCLVESDLHNVVSMYRRVKPLTTRNIHDRLSIPGYKIYLPDTWDKHGQARMIVFAIDLQGKKCSAGHSIIGWDDSIFFSQTFPHKHSSSSVTQTETMKYLMPHFEIVWISHGHKFCGEQIYTHKNQDFALKSHKNDFLLYHNASSVLC